MNADCHIHMVLDGENWKQAIARHVHKPDLVWIRRILSLYQSCGITYLRDGGDRWGVGVAARTVAPEYSITYRTPLAPLYKEGNYGGFIGEPWHDLREYASLVQNIQRHGGDFVKIMISGLMDFDHFGVLTSAPLSCVEVRELIHIAHEEGFAVMAHCNGARVAQVAAVAGVDSIEHGAYLDEEALIAMKENGTIWVPTLSTIGNLRKTGRFNEVAVEKILNSAIENVAYFGTIGGYLAPGTDAGAWSVPHGIQSEYSLLQEALGDETDDILHRGISRIRMKF